MTPTVPVQLTSFVGRGSELGDLAVVAARSRLVTLTGPGGAGKTRLALEHVASCAPVPTVFVDLAPIADGAEVLPAAARALGHDDPNGVSDLVSSIGDEQTIVIVDNCEHVLDDAAALVDELLRARPAVRVVATSREPLRVPGEVVLRVGPLDAADALSLFSMRALAVRPDFRLVDVEEAVAEICHRVDRLPLALELVAAWLRVLTPAELASRLRDHTVDGVAPRGTPRRHRTLDDSIAWSHDLLSAPEQRAFRRFGVFAGSFDLAGAAAVMNEVDVTSTVASLVDKSLLSRTDSGGSTRFRMLETIRAFALRRLGDAGELDEVHDRLVRHSLDVAERLGALDHDEASELLTAEHDNLRTAFEWCVERGDATEALRLLTTIGHGFLWHGRLSEGSRWLRVALGMPGETDPLLRARALALAAFWGGTYAAQLPAEEHSDEAVALARELGDREALKAALSGAARARYLFRPYEAIVYDTELLELARDDEDDHAAALATAGIGIALLGAGEFTNAIPYLVDAVGALRARDHVSDWAQGQAVLAEARLMTGDVGAALEIARATRPHTSAAEPGRWFVLFAGAHALAHRGDTDESARWADELLSLGEEIGLGQPVVLGRYAAGLAALAEGDAARAGASLDAALAQEGSWVDSVSDGRVPVHSLAVAFESTAVALAVDDLDAARRRIEEMGRACTFERGLVPVVSLARARVALAGGDLDGAEELATEALAALQEFGYRLRAIEAVEALAAIAGAAGRHADAVRLLAIADRERELAGARRFAINQPRINTLVEEASSALGPTIDAARARAQGASLDDLLKELRPGGRRRRAAFGWDSLTPAELDVVRLIGEGLTNKEIAARLFVSPRTVQAHLSHVYRKLRVRSRLELARDLAGRG